jgi:hypothetical protein
MESQDAGLADVVSKEDLRADTSRDAHSWWTYVWHTKRQMTPLAEGEYSNRDILDSQGVEIVTLRQVSVGIMFLLIILGSHFGLAQTLRIATTTSGGS